MNTRLKVLKKALRKCENRINFLRREIFENDPISKQLEIHKKFEEFLREKKGEERTTRKSIEYIVKLDKEKVLHEERAKSYDLDNLIQELTTLEIEHNSLVKEEWRLTKQLGITDK